MAFVVLRPGTNTTPDEVIAWAREHIANYKVPRRVEVVERAAAQRERQGARRASCVPALSEEREP